MAQSRPMATDGNQEIEQGLDIVVVVPTIREECLTDFLDQWRDEFRAHDVHVIVMEDNPQRSFKIDTDIRITHLCWEDIENDLGSRAWIIPRRTDCVRSYGYYRAYLEQPDMIVTLDDDCYPLEAGGVGFMMKHWRRLQEGGQDPAWQSSCQGVIPRGVPYYQTERTWPCALNHGLWERVPDFDAPTQLLQSRAEQPFRFINQTIPMGRYFPMCGMNVAFRPEVVPAFYFLLMGRDYRYDRFGDIWSGVFIKKICDHLGYAINSGDPAIDHQRASNVWSNLNKEAPGLEVNETLWSVIDRVVLTETTFAGCYRQLAEGLPEDGPAREYMTKLKQAMLAWTELFGAHSVTTGQESGVFVESAGGGVAVRS